MTNYLTIGAVGSLIYIAIQKMVNVHYEKQRKEIINEIKTNSNKLEKILN